MNLETLQVELTKALEPAFRASLLARGQARSIILRAGALPRGAPQFASTLPYDLIAYGDALLLQGMRIHSSGANEQLARRAFVQAGEALEAAVVNGVPDDPERGFLRILSAAAFHLGRSSARAYSMLRTSLDNSNLSRSETGLALLILRSLDQLEDQIADWRFTGVALDETLVESLRALDVQPSDRRAADDIEEAILIALDTALCDQLYSGLSIFLLALQAGEESLVVRAREHLRTGLTVTADLNLVPQWWCFRLTIHLIDDLWQASLHHLLPKTLPDGENPAWDDARRLFIASLYRRRRAEVELWPSQIDAAHRAVDPSDNLVLSMPTSAGKTRIAELCILRCLADGKRVVYVTPLRALSAQTEVALNRTFAPLGKSVSALYGSIGTSALEEDTLRSRDIVVATPEKLDFALRSDPSLLDDVGLVVLDEGHMIGFGEREIRYEIQIQQLMNRPDAHQRRLVCLSAILPDGDQFSDFVSWIRRDRSGSAISSDWRPTRIRFGEVLWRSRKARLELRVGDERPFVPTYFTEKSPLRGRRKAPFPRTKRELAIATAWRLLEDEHSVIIYCPERRSVAPYARDIVDLESRGLISSALREDDDILAPALAIGTEWFGSSHPILQCLRLGVAIHHGALPTPFRMELERLLRAGVLPVIVSSPTLAQGLNLTATSIIMHDIKHFREGEWKTIAPSDFKNIVGRAGRAFVDVEGLVLCPIFADHSRSQRQWRTLLEDTGSHQLESGLLQLLVWFLQRLRISLDNPDINELAEYVLNNTAAWECPTVSQGHHGQRFRWSEQQWDDHLAMLDTALLSLLGEEEILVEELSSHIDELLNLSFWHRRIERRDESLQIFGRAALAGRANVIWRQTSSSQRRGYCLAGVGLAAGQELDRLAAELNPLLIDANASILEGDSDRAVHAVLRLAELLFDVEPFKPDPRPTEWPEILDCWLKGKPLNRFPPDRLDKVLRFVENGLTYKLPWGVEAVRVRAVANEDRVDDGTGKGKVEDADTGFLVACLETGTLHPSAAQLMQAGFTSRLGAVKAVRDTHASFGNAYQRRRWLRSRAVVERSGDGDWPTAASHAAWVAFRDRHRSVAESAWSSQSGEFPVMWSVRELPKAGDAVRVHFFEDGGGVVLSPSFRKLGTLRVRLAGRPTGVFEAEIGGEASITYRYRGPPDIAVTEST